MEDKMQEVEEELQSDMQSFYFADFDFIRDIFHFLTRVIFVRPVHVEIEIFSSDCLFFSHHKRLDKVVEYMPQSEFSFEILDI